MKNKYPEKGFGGLSVSHSKENRISLKASKPTMSLNRGNRGTTNRVVDFLVRDSIIGSMKTEETE